MIYYLIRKHNKYHQRNNSYLTLEFNTAKIFTRNQSDSISSSLISVIRRSSDNGTLCLDLWLLSELLLEAPALDALRSFDRDDSNIGEFLSVELLWELIASITHSLLCCDVSSLALTWLFSILSSTADLFSTFTFLLLTSPEATSLDGSGLPSELVFPGSFICWFGLLAPVVFPLSPFPLVASSTVAFDDCEGFACCCMRDFIARALISSSRSSIWLGVGSPLVLGSTWRKDFVRSSVVTFSTFTEELFEFLVLLLLEFSLDIAFLWFAGTTAFLPLRTSNISSSDILLHSLTKYENKQYSRKNYYEVYYLNSYFILLVEKALVKCYFLKDTKFR